MGPMPALESKSDTNSTLFIKGYFPFIGPAVGIARAQIYRAADTNADVSGSGVYIGMKIGADYPLKPGMGLRPEISSAMTFASSPDAEAKLLEFGALCALYFSF